MHHNRDDYNKRIQDSEGKIPGDEPVFLIRAQDKVGASAVRAWAELNKMVGGDQKLTDRAYEQADRMDAWPTKKTADHPK